MQVSTTSLTSISASDVSWLLATQAGSRLLSGADLFTMAFALSGRSHKEPLTLDEAHDLLLARGLPQALAGSALVERMRESTSADPAFLVYNASTFCIDRNVGIPRRLGQIVFRHDVQRLLLAHRAERPPPPERPVTRAQARSPARARRTEAPAAPPRSPSTTPTPERPPRARAAGSRATPAGSRATPAGSRATPAASRPPAASGVAEPAPPPEPAPLPAPPPRKPAPLLMSGLDRSELLQRLAGPPSSLAAVSHALRAHLLASAEQFEELLALAALTGVEPHRYQIETARRVLRVFRGRALLADEVGLGKTVEALTILREYQLRGMVRRALVLVPPALVGQWTGELAEKAEIAARTTDDAARTADPEAFWRDEGVVVASLALARSAKHAPLVQAASWDLVIVDEAHHVKSRTTAGFKLVDGLHSRFLLMLTATPIETDLEELYNLVTLLKPGQFATPAAFRAQFVDPKDPLSPKNRERLRALLAEVMVRNTRADSGLALPPRYVSTALVDPLPEERELYERVLALVRARGADAGSRMLASTLLLGAGSSPAAVRGSLERMSASERRAPGMRAALAALAKLAASVRASRKGGALVDLVRAHDEQVLVFTRFRDTLSYIEAVLREAGVEPAAFHGGLSAADKRAALSAFRDGRARVLVSTDAGGEGHNLHHCHVLVNFDLPYNPMLIEQRIGRLHRMGQREEVRVYNLCARGTAEERVLDLLDRRLHLFELVVGEMDMVLGNMADERDLEERIVSLYATSRSEEEIASGFDAIAEELAAARGRYEQVKCLDAKLFGKDYEA
ncbi:DEAD/DEAH box helicase [Sorangium sp. So ce426]|uniref:DEAD/DEAH box helicase n=1 Tax=Sorangium sp. So ce426 TaxID=3133312 RepID=UPI003F5B88BC